MKKISFIFVLGLLVFGFNGFSQTKVFEFTYGDTGNREQREFITLKSAQLSDSGNNQDEEYKTTLENFEVKFYPNPTKGNIKVAITGLGDEAAHVYVYNMQGKLIANDIFKGALTTVDLSMQPAGMYLMKLSVADKSKELKIIKE